MFFQQAYFEGLNNQLNDPPSVTKSGVLQNYKPGSTQL